MLCEARDAVREITFTPQLVEESSSLTSLHENLHKTLETVLEQIDIVRDLMTINYLDN